MSASVTVKAAGVMAVLGATTRSAMALITGALAMLSGTTCVTLPLEPLALHGLVSVSVSLVVVGLANSSKS